MQQKKIIGLLGAAGAGKDSAAGFIREVLPGTSTLAFADPIKEIASLIFEFPTDNLWGKSELRSVNFLKYVDSEVWAEAGERLRRYGPEWAQKVLMTFKGAPDHDALITKMWTWFFELRDESIGKGLTPRRMLQTLGTECARAVNPDIWANFALNRAQALLVGEKRQAVLITDVRFLNESRLLREGENEVWFIDRPIPGLEGDAGKHQSEMEIRSPEMQQYVTRTIKNDGTLDDFRASVQGAVRVVFRQ